MCYGMSPNCPGNLQTCYGHFDSNGCDVPPFCAVECPPSEYDHNGCYVMNDQPECNFDEVSCDLGFDHNVRILHFCVYQLQKTE